MFFSASLLKIALLYASFELCTRVNKLAPTIVWDWKPFFASVESAIPSIPNGNWRRMKLDEILRNTASDAGVLRFGFTRQHCADLRAIFADQNQDGALAAGGFLLETKKGIWYANDLGGGWRQFYVPVATGGRSSVAMTALAMANLLTAMHRGSLIDSASSREMMNIMSMGGSWLQFVANPGSLSFTSMGAKVGDYGSPEAKVSNVKSEGVFLCRTGDCIPFVAVWQNYPNPKGGNSDVTNVYRVIDEVVRKWP
jgi:hypothetical protein